ncbi:CBASS oligonucleotide cyclase [Flaviaesturariibacter terrae]
MKLTNTDLTNFVNRIKLKRDNMPKFRTQVTNLQEDLEKHINEDQSTGIKVTKVIIAGSWKKGTILRATGANPIDIDLVLYVEGGENLQDDLEGLHDKVVEYLEKIYPTKDISRDVDASGKTRSIKIKFTGTGLEVDIVPVVPVDGQSEYVWQPQRGGGGGKYITSVTKQLDFARDRRAGNTSYTAIVRALKWWRNYKELDQLSSFVIELIVSYLEIEKGVEKNIEEGIIRFFKLVSDPSFPTISFKNSIGYIPYPTPNIFVADPTNKENNAAKKIDDINWPEVKSEANDAFETLSIAQSKNYTGDTIAEWKSVFGPYFNINEEE